MTQIAELPCKAGTWAKDYRQLAAMVSYGPTADFCTTVLEWNTVVLVDLFSCIFVILGAFCWRKLQAPLQPLSLPNQEKLKKERLLPQI